MDKMLDGRLILPPHLPPLIPFDKKNLGWIGCLDE